MLVNPVPQLNRGPRLTRATHNFQAQQDKTPYHNVQEDFTDNEKRE